MKLMTTPSLLFLLAVASLTIQPSFGRVNVDNVRPLSSKAKAIYSHVVSTVQETPSESGVSSDSILASGRLLNDIANYGTTTEHCDKMFYPGIVNAKEEVLITTFLFDKNAPCGGQIASKALIDLNKRLEGTGRKVRVYYLISTLSEYRFMLSGFKLPRLSGIFKSLSEAPSHKFNLPDPEELPNLDFRIKTFHHWMLGTIHNKLFIVDGRTLITGSKNWDALPGFEYVTRMEGTIAAVAREDFARIWEEPLPKVSTLATHAASNEYPILYLSRTANPSFSHPEESAQDQGWIRALEVAQKSVYIQTPNFIAQTVVDKVLETVKRGVKVTIVTAFSFHDFASYLNKKSAGNNRSVIRKMYTELLNDPKATKNLNMCYFIGNRVNPPRPQKDEFSHVKYMQVDDEFIIFGSGNQDTQSWYNSSESNYLVDDPEEAKRTMKRLLDAQKSLQHCYRDSDGTRPASDPNWMDEPEPIMDDPMWM